MDVQVAALRGVGTGWVLDPEARIALTYGVPLFGREVLQRSVPRSLPFSVEGVAAAVGDARWALGHAAEFGDVEPLLRSARALVTVEAIVGAWVDVARITMEGRRLKSLSRQQLATAVETATGRLMPVVQGAPDNEGDRFLHARVEAVARG